MLEYDQIRPLDAIDRAMLDILQSEGRISNADLARRINLSPPATHVRLKRLEQEGYIEAYVARLSRTKLGYGMMCYISIGLQMHQSEELEQVRRRLRDMPEVLECCFVTGEFDYLLKVVLRDQSDLERFILGQLSPLPGLARISTSMVVSEIKSSTALPVEQPSPVRNG